MKIVIAGGGTAGWMAALAISRTRKDIDLTVIESSKIGIVGAGEGTTGLFTDFITNQWFDTGVTIPDFVKETNATIKMGIRFKNWTGDNSDYFAPLDGSFTANRLPDTELCEALIRDPENFHLASHGGRCHEINCAENYAYHFDAFLVGKYFAKIATRSGAKHIDSEITNVNIEEDEIKSLSLSNGETVEADFFIDCTGFKRVLMNALGVGWKSYKKWLPVDSAIAFQMPIDQDYERATGAHALKSGWVWKIPTAERYGCGYVYSSEFTTQEEAEAEVKEHYGDVKILRKFKFESGRSENTWHSNCLALGLAAAFAEPLEATSIHTTIIQLMGFLFNNLGDSKEDTCVPSVIDKYNETTNCLYDTLKDFLVLHYMGGRDDSKFWRHIKDKNTITPQVQFLLDKCEAGMIPSFLDVPAHQGAAGIELWNWQLVGLGKITREHALKTLERNNNRDT